MSVTASLPMRHIHGGALKSLPAFRAGDLKITSFSFDHNSGISNFYIKVIMTDNDESVTLLPCEGYIILGLPSPLLQMM